MTSIDAIKSLPSIVQTPAESPLAPGKTAPGGSFGDTLKSFISDVNDMQVQSADKTMKFATGQITDVHEVMAAAEEAGISMMLLLEIRKKMLEGYQELMRTPV
jgi:flagellar hook-basal body complex protein FliE